MTIASQHPLPDPTDPDWTFSDEEELAILDAAARRVAWEKAMAAQGVMTLKLGLTPAEEQSRADAWARSASPDQQASFER